VVAYYQNNSVAWSTISQTSSPKTLLVLDGLLLGKSLQDKKSWIPIIIGFETILQTSPDGQPIAKNLFFWHMLHLHRLLGYKVRDPVRKVLEFLCGVVYTLWQMNHPDEKRPDEWKESWQLIAWFNQLYMKPDNCIQELESLAQDLSDLVVHVIRRISQQKTVGVIITQYTLTNQKFKEVPNFVKKLEDLLLSSSGESHIIQSILNRTYQDPNNGTLIDDIFGAQATGETRTLVQLWKDGDSKRAEVRLPMVVQFNDLFDSEPAGDEMMDTINKAEESFVEPPAESGPATCQPFGPRENLGYGGFELARNQVVSLLGKPPPVFYSFVDKPAQHAELAPGGMSIAYLLHHSLHTLVERIRVLNGNDDEKLLLEENEEEEQNEEAPPQLNNLFTKWLVNMLRSPLPNEYKMWFLHICQHMSARQPPPECMAPERKATSIIASCLSQNCPVRLLRDIFKGGCLLSDELQPFCRVGRLPLEQALLSHSDETLTRSLLHNQQREKTTSMGFTWSTPTHCRRCENMASLWRLSIWAWNCPPAPSPPTTSMKG